MDNLQSGNYSMNAYIAKYGSVEKAIEGCSNEPSHLIELFKAACKSSDHTCCRIFERIEALESKGELDIRQIENVIKISNKFNSIHSEGLSKIPINAFFEKHLNSKNVYHYLELAEKLGAEEQIKKCLGYIEIDANIEIVDNASTLSIVIKDPKIPFDQLSKQIDQLSILGKTIEITLNPIAPSDLVALKDFVVNKGPLLIGIDLSNKKNIDDAFAEIVEKFCPNIHSLSISSEVITDKGLKNLANIKSLRKLHLLRCIAVTKIPTLPQGLIELNLSGCRRLTRLQALPESLTMLNCSDCFSLTVLSDELPKNLATLDFSRCGNLTNLPMFPPGLAVLKLPGCRRLGKLPEEFPQSLKEINLLGCSNLTKVPRLPAGLNWIYLLDSGVTSDNRLSNLSTLFDDNMETALTRYKDFNVDFDSVAKLFAEKLLLKPILETQDPRIALVEAITLKFSNMSTPPHVINILAKFTYTNKELLHLDIDHPLIYDSMSIMLSTREQGDKDPFVIFRKLKELELQPVRYSTPAMKIDDVYVAINRSQLEALSKSTQIRREDLPANATLEAFEGLEQKIAKKLKTAEAQRELNDKYDANEFVIQYPIPYFKGFFQLSGEKVSDVEAKCRAILSNILDKNDEERNSSVFTEREELLILTLMGIQNCDGGKAAGIALTYVQLDLKYQYKSSISAPPDSPSEAMKREKKQSAFEFLKLFMAKPFNSEKERSKALITLINGQLIEHSKIVIPLIEDGKYWDEDEGTTDYILNEVGAAKLLELVKVERDRENLSFINEFVAKVIQKLLAFQFSGTNQLMKELTNTPNNTLVDEGAHQSIYLKNLIGRLVGISDEVVFDRLTKYVNSELLKRDREEVLKIFFEHITPESYIQEITKAINSESDEIKNSVKNFLNEDKFWSNENLNRSGALSLLERLHYLEVKTQLAP